MKKKFDNTFLSRVIEIYMLRNLIRGPYLQSMLPTGVKRWRTEVPAIRK
ncbi:MAG: hypothetical protein IPF63_11590 [Bacteroidetes bacterium]|nr:hypothetical protein [Bacteroidota bacterium]